MKLLDGKLCSEQIRREIKEDVDAIKASGKRPPHLAAILVGDDGASQNYVSMKVKDCEEVGFSSTLVQFDANVSEQELLDKIAELNADDTIDGFIVQLPLPDHINDNKVILAIDPRKDVDGFCPENIGNLCLDLPTFVSATPNGIMELLRRYNIETEGKHCVVLGRSNIVGTPMAILLSRNNNTGNATVTIAHSRTKNLPDVVRRADIVVAAVGRAQMVPGDWIKPGATVIDVGINRIDKPEGGTRLVGDVDYESCAAVAGAITPVPGGVGPMTIACLLANTVTACCRSNGVAEPEGLTV